MEISSLNVTELRNGLLKGEFSPKEILDSTINKIHEIDNNINAFPIRCFEKAYKQIEELPSIKDIDFETHPLYGIPVGVKDLNDIKGVLTTQGSELFKGYLPKSDDNIVACMRKNGALFPGKTNVPEHGLEQTVGRIL